MARPASELADALVGHLGRTNVTRRRCERLFSEGRMKRDDIELVYQGLFLDAVCSFERFVEGLFVGLLCEHVAHPSRRVRTKVRFGAAAVCRQVLAGSRPFIDWLPFDRTQKLAERFLAEGLPFSEIAANDVGRLQNVSLIRNAVAHRSRHAIKVFENSVLGQVPLLAHERTPAGYLRSVYVSAPAQTRYEESVIVLAGVAKALVSRKMS